MQIIKGQRMHYNHCRYYESHKDKSNVRIKYIHISYKINTNPMSIPIIYQEAYSIFGHYYYKSLDLSAIKFIMKLPFPAKKQYTA